MINLKVKSVTTKDCAVASSSDTYFNFNIRLSTIFSLDFKFVHLQLVAAESDCFDSRLRRVQWSDGLVDGIPLSDSAKN